MPDISFMAGAQFLATTEDVDRIGSKLDALTGLMSKRDPRPLYQTVAATGTGAANGAPVTVTLGGPNSGRVWDIRQLLIDSVDDHAGVFSSSVVGVAANAGTLNVTNGAALLGFDITSATAAAAVSGEVTVGPVQRNGQTLRYQYTMTPNGSILSKSFTPPLFPGYAGSTGLPQAIAITVPAIVGGSAFDITAYTQAYASWYVSLDSGLVPGQLLATGVPVPTTLQPASSESVWLHFGEKLSVVVYGMPSGQQFTCIARIADWADGSTEARKV